MTIVMLHNSMVYGGAENLLIDLAESLNTHNKHVEIYCCNNQVKQLNSDIKIIEKISFIP